MRNQPAYPRPYTSPRVASRKPVECRCTVVYHGDPLTGEFVIKYKSEACIPHHHLVQLCYAP